MRYHSSNISVAEALNVPTAARYAAGLLSNSSDYYSARGFSDELSQAASVRDYNASPDLRGKGHRGKHERTLGYLTIAQESGDLAALNGHTTGHDYVTNVLDIAKNCFNLKR